MTATRPGFAALAIAAACRSVAVNGSALHQIQLGSLGALLQRGATARQTGVGHEIMMRAEWWVLAWFDTMIRARGVRDPALHIVLEVRDHNLIEDLLMHGRVLDRQQGLETPIHVARHPVGRRDEDLRLARGQRLAGTEADDARMFEEAPDNALDPDILRQAGKAGPEAAHPAH